MRRRGSRTIDIMCHAKCLGTSIGLGAVPLIRILEREQERGIVAIHGRIEALVRSARLARAKLGVCPNPRAFPFRYFIGPRRLNPLLTSY